MVLAIPLFTYPSNKDTLTDIYFNSEIDDQLKFDSIRKGFFSTSAPVSQLNTATQIIELATTTNNSLWLYRGYYYKGNAHTAMAELDKACEAYLNSLDAIKKLDKKEGIGDIYLGLGNAYSISGDHTNAIKFYNNAFEEYKQRSDTLYMGFILVNIVNEFHANNLLDSVEHYLKKTDEICRNFENASIQGFKYGHSATLKAKRGQIKESFRDYEKAKTYLEKRRRVYDIVSFQFELASIHYKNNNIKLALHYAQECHKQAVSANLKEQIRDASKLLYQIFLNREDYYRALQYQTQYINYSDSINNEEVIRKMADLRTEYEISKKQVEIDLLEKKRQNTRIVLIAVISLTLILALFTYMLFANNRHKKKVNLLINEQKNKLIEHKKTLEDINSTKDKMFSIVSHDLRSPIHSLTGISSMMKELVESNDKDELLLVNKQMHVSLTNVSALLDNLLEWAGNQQDHIPYNPSNINIYEEFQLLHEIFKDSAKAKGVHLEVYIDHELSMHTDRNTFSTIFRNLIGNAIKYTNSGDNITISNTETNGKVIFKVSDTGVGIPENRLNTLFDLKSNKSTWGTANEKGIGLGLRLAYEFTLLNKGKIWAESRENAGTTFFVEFPVNGHAI